MLQPVAQHHPVDLRPVGAGALLVGSIPLMFAVLFAMGVHSTVFGPVKYSILPQHLREEELMGGTIDVTSELGRGTTFEVRLPQEDGVGLADRR